MTLSIPVPKCEKMMYPMFGSLHFFNRYYLPELDNHFILWSVDKVTELDYRAFLVIPTVPWTIPDEDLFVQFERRGQFHAPSVFGYILHLLGRTDTDIVTSGYAFAHPFVRDVRKIVQIITKTKPREKIYVPETRGWMWSDEYFLHTGPTHSRTCTLRKRRK